MRRPILRVLAFVAAALVPLAWLLTLGGDPLLQRTNYFRLLGGIFGAGSGWILWTVRGSGPDWRTCLGGGIVGSLLVSALSVPFPALGRISMSGWLTSGLVGGGMVALILFAWKGRVGAEESGGSKRRTGR